MSDTADYVDALDHIMRVARKSRTQSRRLRWIEARARCALEGGEDWKELDLPKFSESNQRYLQTRVAELEQQLAAIQAEARELRTALARARELTAKWRAAPQNPDEPLLAMAADELEAALYQPAEPDEWKLAVDHELTNMQTTADSYPSAKEAVKALIEWHVAVATDPVFQQPAERESGKKACGCIYATSANTESVRKGYEMGGYVKQFCPEHAKDDDHESLPLMARRGWMFKSAQYAFRNRDSAWFQSVDKPGGIWEFCYRIADTDENGLRVIPRTADMPEDVTHMTLHTRRFFRAGELRARAVEGDEGLVRIEDYRGA